MHYSQNFSCSNGETKRVSFDSPNECPRCHSKIEPRFLYGFLHSRSADYAPDAFYAFFYCSGCGKAFIADYDLVASPVKLVATHPWTFDKRIFSKEISTVSKDFTEIYNQSLEAETMNLNMIAGIGYRKSLEHLVKDYIKFFSLNKNKNGEPEDIDSVNLQKCINSYLGDNELKSLMTVSYWIGNDATHYAQKYDELTIDDMKRFIESVVSIVERKVRLSEAQSIINNRNQSKTQ